MKKEKAYFEEIKKQIQPYKDVIYYEPISEQEMADIENEWKMVFKPIVREFLLNFGFTQDVIKELELNKEDMRDNLDWLREKNLNNYIPIQTKFTGEKDLVIALKNDVNEGDYLYEIDLEASNKSKMVKRKNKTFSGIIEKAISNFNVNKRCKNTNKMRCTEFIIEASDFEILLLALEDSKIKQVTEWKDKYYPENLFGAKIAKFEMFDKIRLFFEKDEMGVEYKFTIDEPILLDKNKSLILKTEELLNKSQLDFDKVESRIIECE